MNKIFLTAITLFWLSATLYSQEPPGYYDAAAGLSGEELQQALHDIIDNHSVEGYGDLWNDF